MYISDGVKSKILHFQAGLSSSINSSQLIIALEPEAAAVYCRQRKLREFVEEKGDETVKDTLVPAKTQYLVVDNGGKNSSLDSCRFYLEITFRFLKNKDLLVKLN